MKVILGANISVNGKILLGENPSHDVPEQAVQILVEKATQAGNLIIGRKTYEFMAHFPGGIRGMLPGLEIVIISSNYSSNENIVVVSSCEKAMTYLANRGFEEIAIGGGTQIYNAFLNADLVTDIYFNIIPVMTGDGGVLGTSQNLATRFALRDNRALNDGIVQLHYERATTS